jgi:signal transduction histidine kinase
MKNWNLISFEVFIVNNLIGQVRSTNSVFEPDIKVMKTRTGIGTENASLRQTDEEKLQKSYIRSISFRRLVIFIALIFVVSTAIIILSEILNDWLLPRFALWEVHLLTIVGIPISVTIAAYFVRKNEAELYRNIVRENLERKKTEQKLKQVNHELNELNATKDKLFKIIAHDLKSPFTSILGFSELLIENIRTRGPENSEEFLTHINTTAEHTLTLLDNLLTWAKSQTGQIDFKAENLHLGPIVEEIVVLLNLSATIKNITLNNSVSDDIFSYADPNMLKTILRNLVQNAIKFTNSGGTVDIHAVTHQNQTVFTVTDNGVGMSKETQKNIFRIDATVIASGTAHERGSGLGLILCKEFVEKHGGKIWAEGELGKGCEFKFTLPLNRT